MWHELWNVARNEAAFPTGLRSESVLTSANISTTGRLGYAYPPHLHKGHVVDGSVHPEHLTNGLPVESMVMQQPALGAPHCMQRCAELRLVLL